MTSGPSVTRSVAMATAASVTHGSASARDRLAVRDVVPDEEAVPAALLGARGELGDQRRLGELLERRYEDGMAGATAASLANGLGNLES